MNNKGVSLVELLIVIVVLGIIATVTTINVVSITENTAKKVDASNAKSVNVAVEQAFDEGVLIIRNNRLYNTQTERAYSGTGTWFYDDMGDYMTNRIVPQSKEARNRYNKDGSTYKFRFLVRGNEVTIYYMDTAKKKVLLYTSVLD